MSQSHAWQSVGKDGRPVSWEKLDLGAKIRCVRCLAEAAVILDPDGEGEVPDRSRLWEDYGVDPDCKVEAVKRVMET